MTSVAASRRRPFFSPSLQYSLDHRRAPTQKRNTSHLQRWIAEMAKVKAIKKHSYSYGGERISFERGDEFQLVAKAGEKWLKVRRLTDKRWTQGCIYVPSQFMKEVGPDANPQPADTQVRKMSCPEGMPSNTNKSKSVTATITKVSSLPELTAKSRSNANHPEKLVEPPLQAKDGSNAGLSVDLKHSQSSTHILENPPPLHHSRGGENEQVRSEE